MKWWVVILMIFGIFTALIVLIKLLSRNRGDSGDLSSAIFSVRNRFDAVCGKIKRMIGC